MDLTYQSRLLAALCRVKGISWTLVAREAQRERSVEHLLNGEVVEQSAEATEARYLLANDLGSVHSVGAGIAENMAFVEYEISLAEKAGARFVTVLDDDYPANLRMIPNLPPFLFIRGEILPDDLFSVAVVGTREASAEGLEKAERMARLLSERSVTVVSGLAYGIDTAAHTATLEAGGRTIAVLGTGITKTYPKENKGLAERIAATGALVSQFWPSRSGGRDTFPRRNVVTSGISQGTVVIEASSTSGAKMQARLALEHGKKVFLVTSLVTGQKWARQYVDERGAIEVGQVDEVIRHLRSPETIQAAGTQRQQLSLHL
jgi:DNA processing protein